MVTNPTGQLVKIVDVTKTYVTKGRPVVQALENVSLGIGRGELVAVVGPSGCGKTTLLSVLAGLVAPSSGSVEIDGVRVDRPYSDLGIVFQKDLLLEWRTVLSNVMLQAEIRSLDKKELKAKALGLLGQVGLSGFADSFPGELSGGMRQRVSICRALVHDPALLLMDEPFAALDAFTRDDVSLDFLRLVQERQKTVFFITHSIEEAVFLADRVVVMTSRPSRIAEVSTIDLPHPRHLGIRDTTEFVRFTGRIRAIFEKQRELAGESRRMTTPNSTKEKMTAPHRTKEKVADTRPARRVFANPFGDGKIARIIQPLSAAVLVIAIWWAAVLVFQINSFILPSPDSVAEAIVTNFGLLVHHSLVTIQEILWGFVIGALFGVVAAAIIVFSPLMRRTLYPLLVAGQMVPKVAVAPLFVVWFGTGEISKVAVAFVISFFPVVISTAVGLESVDSDMIKLFRSMGASPLQSFFKLRLPAALPSMFGGLKVSISLAVVGAIVGEFVTANQGLGFYLLYVNGQLKTDIVFAILIVLSIIGIILFFLVQLLEIWLVPKPLRGSAVDDLRGGA